MATLSLQDNITLEKLNLQGNWIEGAGGLAMARMLEDNDYITELVNYFCLLVILFPIPDAWCTFCIY